MSGIISVRQTAVGIWNIRCANSTAVGAKPNGEPVYSDFHFHDPIRLPRIVHGARKYVERAQQQVGNGKIVLCLKEAWGASVQSYVHQSLADVLPYKVLSTDRMPGYGGIGRKITEIYENWPEFMADAMFKSKNQEEEAKGLVRRLIEAHYSLEEPGDRSSLGALMTEDLAPWLISKFFTSGGPIWDSGLMCLSNVPFLEEDHFEHPVNVQWDRFTRKGGYRLTIGSPDNFTHLDINHLQEGVTPKAIEARVTQLRAIKTRNQGRSPLIIAGDLNIARHPHLPDEAPQNREYVELCRILEGMKDARGEATYHDPNVYQKSMGAYKNAKKRAVQLDYIFYNHALDRLICEVLSGPDFEFTTPEGEIFESSDHRLLWGAFVEIPEASKAFSYSSGVYPQVSVDDESAA